MDEITKSTLEFYINSLEDKIKRIVTCYSAESIVLHAFSEYSLIHKYDFITRERLKIGKRDVFEKFSSVPGLIADFPQWIVCFALANSSEGSKIPEDRFEILRNHVLIWTLLTLLKPSGTVYATKRLHVNPNKGTIDWDFDWKSYMNEARTFGTYAERYLKSEALRGFANLPQLRRQALDVLEPLDNVMMKDFGFRGSKAIELIYRIAWEWGEMFKVLDENETEAIKSMPIQLTQEHVERLVIRRLGLDQDEKSRILKAVILSKDIAEKNLCIRGGRKRDKSFRLHSYPLWDHPLLIIDDQYITHVDLLADCLHELMYKLIILSDRARDIFIRRAHADLVRKVLKSLQDNNYRILFVQKKFQVNKGHEQEYDIIAAKNSQIFNVECKTVRLNWRTRMYFNPKEFGKLALDFFKHNNLTKEKWHKKLETLRRICKDQMKIPEPVIIGFVVTDLPHPAFCISKDFDMVWLEDLETYLQKMN